jgi:uncharacterized protein YsxB (DUF464 family)
MTKIYLEQDGDRFTISANGHATGSVELCSAISTLLYTLDAWLHNADVSIRSERLNAGSAFIEYTGNKDSDAAQVSFDMTAIGFLQLEKEYPEIICVDKKIIS